MDVDRLKKLAGAVRTGGKGTVRRKKKAVHKATSTDDKRLQNTLKRLGVNTIPGIEEVMIMKDSQVIHFSNPKVQASIAANTYVVNGPSQERSFQDMLPSLLPHMQSPADIEKLKGMLEQNGMQGMPGNNDDDDDDDVPDLVETFDENAQIRLTCGGDRQQRSQALPSQSSGVICIAAVEYLVPRWLQMMTFDVVTPPRTAVM
eukprot:TRINITY_DN3046_c1_g1_i5.p1 TRINITY_DN3046_c1_g1~~TRINITY_DN3046_c1_g1_i5.p1  ORF type:complete len:203 (-),score=26.52 TRINITY_DN3046_c1_g1_i5:61-669(-)